jgi:uncharacterized oligopeptide transporter (OPT) family protein
MSLPARILTGLIVAAGLAFAIAAYFVARRSDQGYWAPLVPVFVAIYTTIAVTVVVGVDIAVRWAIQRRRAARLSS